jgi:hypothetical protein
MWAALFGAGAVWPLLRIFRSLGAGDRAALAAVVLTLVSPLFWMTSLRPLSDVPGLVAGLIAQALLLTALRGVGTGSDTAHLTSPQWWSASVLGALAAGVAIGVRSQNVWLTLPLLLLVMARSPERRPMLWLRMASALAIGVGAWAIPLLIATGGVSPYLQAFSGQAAEDWRDARILATSFAWSDVTSALTMTFVFPWGTGVLAAIVLSFVATGLVTKALRSPRPLVLLVVMYAPYLIFPLASRRRRTPVTRCR